MIYCGVLSGVDESPAVRDKVTFPDGTFTGFAQVWPGYGCSTTLTWFYENDAELFELQCIVDRSRAVCPNIDLHLYLPYVPNARMDRIKSVNQLFTLKSFAGVINQMRFSTVTVVDPHSDVTTALIDRVRVIRMAATTLLPKAVDEVLGADRSYNDYVVCYPDAGSAKRFAVDSAIGVVTCEKVRNFDTGKIESLTLSHPDKVVGKTVFIVDDICSYGGTFQLAASALRSAGALDVVLVVTHCENSILKGKIFDPEEGGLISKVFTTNSIFSGEHKDIHVTKL